MPPLLHVTVQVYRSWNQLWVLTFRCSSVASGSMTKPARTDPIAVAVNALTAAVRDIRLTPPRILTPDSLLTIDETAAELRICRSNLYKLMSADRIRTIKLGNRTLIQYRELLRFIDSLDAAP